MAIKNNIDNYKKKVKEISPFVLIKHDYIMAQLIPTKSSKTTEPERIFNEIKKIETTQEHIEIMTKKYPESDQGDVRQYGSIQIITD